MNKKPSVKLVGTDGNVFILIGKVSRALKDAGEFEEARMFQEEVLNALSYDEALRIIMEFVEVE